MASQMRIVIAAAQVLGLAMLTTAYPLRNCTSKQDFIADDSDLCVYYHCQLGYPSNYTCAKGTRLPSYYNIGVDNPCTVFVTNSKCLRCDIVDVRPDTDVVSGFCTKWKDLCDPGCTCVDQVDGYYCDCSKVSLLATGLPTVEHKAVPACKTNICLNGGTCHQLFDQAPLCICQIGFTGAICEHKLCDFNPCKNEGRCVSNGTSVRCECPQCFKGPCCEERDLEDPDCLGCGACAAGADCKQLRTWLCKCNPCPDNQLCSDTPRNTVRRCSKASAAASDKFTLMFEENWTRENAALEVYATSGEDDGLPRTVNVNAPLGSGSCVYNDTQVIMPGQVFKFNVPICFRHDGTGKQRNGIRIQEVDGRTITLYAINRATFSADSWLCLPDSTAGTNFVVIGYKGFQEFKSQFGIVAVSNNTNVTIFLSANSDLPGTTRGSVVSVVLNAYETYQVQGVLPQDLTGTVIESSLPVHVVAGQVRAYVEPSATNPLRGLSGGTSRDNLVEEIIPTDYWGTTFAVVPSLRAMINYTYTEELLRIVGSTSTSCILYSSNPSVADQNMALTSANRFFWEGYIDASANYFISCNNPVLLMEITESALQGISLFNDPALIYVPAVSQYSNFYKFAPPIFSVTGGPYTYVLTQLAAVESDYSSITINGLPTSPSPPNSPKSWSKLKVPTPTPPDPDNFPVLYGGVFNLPNDRTSNIRHPSARAKFMCIIYAFDNRESIGHVAGTSLSTTNTGLTFDVTRQ